MNLPDPVEVLLDPISLCSLGIYALLILLEAIFPARKLPVVKFWKWIGVLSFFLFFYISSYLPMIVNPLLEPYRLLDLSTLDTGGAALIGIMLYEFSIYLWHRAMHRYDLLWKTFHQLHHSAERVDTYGAFFFSPLDMIGWTVLGSICFGLIVGLSPQAITITFLFNGFLGIFQHANIRTPVWLGFFIQRPEAHTYHHARGIHRCNYSDLPIFDILFGTFRYVKEHHEDAGFYPGASGRVRDMLLFRDVSTKETRLGNAQETLADS